MQICCNFKELAKIEKTIQECTNEAEQDVGWWYAPSGCISMSLDPWVEWVCIGVCAGDVTKFAQKQFVKRAQKIKRDSLDILLRKMEHGGDWGNFHVSCCLSKFWLLLFLSAPYMCSFCWSLAVGLLYYVIYVGMPPSHPLAVCSRDKGCMYVSSTST